MPFARTVSSLVGRSPFKATRFAFLALFLAFAFSGAAEAQTPIEIDQTTEGALDSTDTVNAAGVRYDCYTFDAAPRTKWFVVMVSTGKPVLQIGRGSTCADMTHWDNETSPMFGGRAQTAFQVGGGSYLVLVGSPAASPPSTYRLTVSPTQGLILPFLPASEATPVRRADAQTTRTASTVEGPVSGAHAGSTIKDCPSCPPMVVVPAGSFMMGSPASESGRTGSEGPRHIVSFARAFAIGRTEITFAEYDACITTGGCRRVEDSGFGRGQRPVLNVTYFDAQRYVAWLSAETGQRYFLPSESEWEYAARAGTDTPWNTGSAILTDDANILDQFRKTVVVGSYPANAFGLHDMHGNVGEWVQDCLDTGYVGAPADGSAATSGDCAAKRIIRDGSWRQPPSEVRSARRGIAPSAQSLNGVGFRVTRALCDDCTPAAPLAAVSPGAPSARPAN